MCPVWVHVHLHAYMFFPDCMHTQVCTGSSCSAAEVVLQANRGKQTAGDSTTVVGARGGSKHCMSLCIISCFPRLYTLSLTHTHIHSLSLSYTHKHKRTHKDTQNTHKCAHTHTHTHTRTHTGLRNWYVLILLRCVLSQV